MENNFKATPQAPQQLMLDNQGRRIEVETIKDAGGKKLRAKNMAERKDRIYRKDLALLSHAYDIRMDAAYEIPIAADDCTTSGISSNASHEVSLDGKPWSQLRLKRRVTYKQRAHPSMRSNNSSASVE